MTSGDREICFREPAERTDGNITLGWYSELWQNTVNLNKNYYEDFFLRARACGFSEEDSKILTALLMIGVICHEVSHATHDRQLDSVVKDVTDEKEDTKSTPYLEDEVLCRAKAASVQGEIVHILRCVFPDLPSELGYQAWRDDLYSLENTGQPGLIDRTREMYPHLKSATPTPKNPGEKTEEAIAAFYEGKIATSVIDAIDRTPEEIAATLKISNDNASRKST